MECGADWTDVAVFVVFFVTAIFSIALAEAETSNEAVTVVVVVVVLVPIVVLSLLFVAHFDSGQRPRFLQEVAH
jgi:hypothetical protein